MSAPWASGSWRRLYTVRYYLKTLRSRNDVAPSIVVNFADTKQTIDGFGGAQPQAGLTSALADLFFTTASGIGLTLFRLSYATNSTGPTPYYPEQSTIAGFYGDAALASARGASVWASPWSAMNTTWKDNASFVEGNLLSAHFGDFSSFCAGLQADLVAAGGPVLYAQSVLNEPDLTTATYTSMQMTAADMVLYIKNNFGPALAGLTPRPKLLASECFNWDHTGTYLATLLADPVCASYIDIIATHQYAGSVAALNTTKKVWVTEMSGIGDTFDATITHALVVARWIHDALAVGNVNAWHYWWLANTNNADNEGLIGNAGDSISAPTMTKRFYAFGNYSKFVRPGMVRVGVAGTLSGVSMTAYKDTSTGAHALVAINASASPVTAVFGFAGLAVSSVTPYVTDASRDLAAQTAIGVVNNRFTATLPASSVTTFSGAGA